MPTDEMNGDPYATFMDPIAAQRAHWEALHTFNPAAIVRNGKIDVYYRAEDSTGSMAIGTHTSSPRIRYHPVRSQSYTLNGSNARFFERA